MLPETQIMRKPMFDEYVEMITEYIHRVTGDPYESIRPWVQELCRAKYRPKKLKHVKTVRPGSTKLVEEDLAGYIDRFRDKIITPSGSIYYPSGQKMSFISQMIADKLAERKKVKSKMMDCRGKGDFVTALFYHYQQANIKINVNALTGGFASPYNILYDKGGYNGITSSARSMITRVNTIAEQLLGGNFAWFRLDELINHIILNIRIRPSDEQIRKMVDKYHLKVPTKDMLKDFYTKILRTYLPLVDMTKVYQLVDSLSTEEVTFLWYYCNLVHLFQENDFCKPFIEETMHVDHVQPLEGMTPKDGWKLDSTVVAIAAVTYIDQLGGYNQKQICEEHNEYLGKLVAYTKFLEEKLHSLDDLFETFIWTDADIGEVKSKPAMRRNIVIISDTDSTIFECSSWDKYYRGFQDGLDKSSYHVTSLCIYWLHHTVVHALKRFSTYFGVDPTQRSRLAMKNEFLYPVVLIYPLKKTYAGLQLIQEGVIFKDPEPDIKGGQLRSSAIAKPALDFVRDLLIEDVLKPTITSRISGNAIIEKVVEFERNIIKGIQAGQVTFMKVTSLGMEYEYKDPGRTPVIQAWKLWQAVFAKKYGDMNPPLKVPMIPINQPNSSYLDWLKKESPAIFQKLGEYLSVNGTLPNNMIINPAMESIPEEIRPLIDIRSIVHAAMKPTYQTLSVLKIGVDADNATKLLLSDVYHEENLLGMSDSTEESEDKTEE